VLVACLVHHEGERADEHKCRRYGDEDQNGCVGTDNRPLRFDELGWNSVVPRHQSAEFERHRRADRDPKEEQRAGRPREAIRTR
jgi:hypothetical protein